MYAKIIKPLIDRIFAFFFLLAVSPIFLITLFGLYIANKGSVFFFQLRPGKDEKIFKIIKFKTMTDAVGSDGELLPDAVRLTPFGKFVRATSLDEIPQLINVLIGNMSIIGPRPLLPEYLLLYNEVQKKRHLVKPGITGWAQVNGRNAISWDKKLSLDVWYVENQSFSLDFSILIKTIKKVFIREGINSKDEATTEKFKGSQKQ